LKVYQSKAEPSQPLARHTVVMGTTATLKTRAPAVPVRAKIYSSFNKKAPAPKPPSIPAKPLETKITSSVKIAAPKPPVGPSKIAVAPRVNATVAKPAAPSISAIATASTLVAANKKIPPATSAAAAAAIAAANQIGSPDSSVSDKDEWGTPEGIFTMSP